MEVLEKLDRSMKLLRPKKSEVLERTKQLAMLRNGAYIHDLD